VTEELLVFVYSHSSFTYLWKFNYIKKETQYFTFILQMNSPCDESTMIGQCPGTCYEMKITRVLLLEEN
jgi:hypothetical protein